MKVYLIAGEASGDKLGAALMDGLSALCKDTSVQFHGVGGPLMQARGLNSLFDMSELSVMGLAEILPKLPHLFRRRDQVVRDILAVGPDVVVTIDSPDFCLRVARKLKTRSQIRVVHYVAPSVWAWRPRRVERMVGVVDHVLALLPFEPPYMHRAGLACDFVGHPVVEEPVASDTEVISFRARHDLGSAPVVLALPGSRKGEVARLMGRFGSALGQVAANHPTLRVVLPAAPAVAPMITEGVRDWPVEPIILDPRDSDVQIFETEKRAAFRAADIALAASGTVSLELAANTTPMVIAYDMSWLSRHILKTMLKIDTVTLVNLVSETRVVPEFLGDHCKAEAIAQALDTLLASPEARLEQHVAAQTTMERLGRGEISPGLRAAKVVLRIVDLDG